MKAENLKRYVVFILLVFALVFSTMSVTPLAHSGESVYGPGGTTIEVVQGGTFLIRHTLEWDEPENGAYGITIAWDCYDNKPEENFTFVDNSAYFTTGDYVGESILAEVTWLVAPSPDYPGSTRYILSVRCPANKKDPRNGQFNVDITLSASGVGGVPHIVGDHVIPFQAAGIIIIEATMKSWNRYPITTRVLESILGVEVSISPESKSEGRGETLTFAVTVKNTGDYADNYELTISDGAGWGATLAQNLLTIPAGENSTTTVSVTVPSDADENESTGITVTVNSQADPNVSDYDTCTTIAERVPSPGSPIPIPVIGGAAIGVGAVAVIVLLLKRGGCFICHFCARIRAPIILRLRRQ
ncbi:hypothetical protein ES703_08385 [subsurface metagenome]